MHVRTSNGVMSTHADDQEPTLQCSYVECLRPVCAIHRASILFVLHIQMIKSPDYSVLMFGDAYTASLYAWPAVLGYFIGAFLALTGMIGCW